MKRAPDNEWNVIVCVGDVGGTRGESIYQRAPCMSTGIYLTILGQ